MRPSVRCREDRLVEDEQGHHPIGGGQRAGEHGVVAASSGVVVLVQSVTSGANARRLERELVLAFDSGATPVVVLNKADLVEEREADDAVTTASDVAPGVDVVVVSAYRGDNVDR